MDIPAYNRHGNSIGPAWGVKQLLFSKLGIENSAKYNVSRYYDRFDSYIEEEAYMIKSFLTLVKEKDLLKKAFQGSDKEELFKNSKELYKMLNKNNDITHFYFIKPDGKVLLRVHDFEKDSDTVNRYTFLKAKETNSTFHGIEFGLKKNYTLRVVSPWIEEGKIIGYIEIGKEIDKIIETLSRRLGIEVFFAIKKDEYKNSAPFVKKKLNALPQTKKHYIVYETLPVNNQILQAIEEKEHSKWLELKGKHYIVYTNTLKDVSQKELGEILFLVDITKSYKLLTDSVTYYVTIMVLGTFFVLLAGYFLIKRKQKKLNNLWGKLENEKTNAQNAYEEINNLLSLFDKGDSVLFKWNNDKDKTVEYVSSNVKNLLGYTKDEFLKQKKLYNSRIHKDDLEYVKKETKKGLKSPEGFFKHDPYRIVTRNGEIKWVLDYCVLSKNNKGEITHLLGYIINITEREEIYRNLEKFIDTQDNIVILTDGETISFANKKMFSFLGFEDLESFQKEHECICDYFLDTNDRFFHLGKVPEGRNWLEEMGTLPHSQRIVSMLGSDFVIHAFSVTVNKFDENLQIVSFTDITQTMLNHIRLEEKTIHDKLTGAYNREYFEQNYQYKIDQFSLEDYKLGLAILDIDHFKRVNDTFGHDTGDKVLQHFVKTVQKFSRSDDTLIRWGGEEFIVILKVRSEDDLKKALEHIRKVVELEKFEVIGNKTCSIGGTLYKDSEDIKKTIKRADEAVYEAKANGRNQVVIN